MIMSITILGLKMIYLHGNNKYLKSKNQPFSRVGHHQGKKQNKTKQKTGNQ